MTATNVLAGILIALAVTFVGVGAFFVRAWSQRRQEGEYLLFGLLSVGLSVYTGGLAPIYALEGAAWAATWPRTIDVATLGALVSIALAVHFALRFGKVAVERPVMMASYAVVLFFGGVVLAGKWWERIPEAAVPVDLLGVRIYSTPSYPTPLALSGYAVIALGVVAMCAILARAVISGNREARAAFLGSGILCATVFNDASVASAKRVGVFLTPFGYGVFAFGVALTLLSRYGRLSTELELQGEDLRKRTRELRRSYRELQKAQRELVRKEQLAVVGELAAVIAHEVRNPLAIIANAVAGLRRKDLAPEDRTTLLSIIDEETGRLNRLVGDLLSYARPITPQRQLLTLRDLLERSLSLAEAHPEVRIELQEASGVPGVWGDASLLRQVFDNLVGNAVQAMGGMGSLSVTIAPHTQDDAPGAMVSIRDTGEGMDTQVRSRAKTPFFTTRPSGTGLGLAIVDRIVDAHGGTMTLESRPGEGTTVGVFLPQGQESQPPPRLGRTGDSAVPGRRA